MNRLLRLLSNLPAYFRVLGVRGMLDFARIRYSRSRDIAALRLRGLTHPLWLRPASTDVQTFREVFLAQDYAVPMSASRIANVIDGGANIGLASVWLASKLPHAQIVAVEPEQTNFEILRRNTAGYPQITAVHGALWGTNGPLMLFDPGRGAHGFTTGEADTLSRAMGTVEGYRVDALLQRMGWGTLDLLKLDIEGAEKEVFESSASWIGCVRAVMVELHDRIKPGCSDSFHRATRHMEDCGCRGKVSMRVAS